MLPIVNECILGFGSLSLYLVCSPLLSLAFVLSSILLLLLVFVFDHVHGKL